MSRTKSRLETDAEVDHSASVRESQLQVIPSRTTNRAGGVAADMPPILFQEQEPESNRITQRPSIRGRRLPKLSLGYSQRTLRLKPGERNPRYTKEDRCADEAPHF